MDNVFDTEAGGQERLGQINQAAQRLLEDAKIKLQPVDEWVRRMARERPVVTLLGAIGIGYLVGRLVARR